MAIEGRTALRQCVYLGWTARLRNSHDVLVAKCRGWDGRGGSRCETITAVEHTLLTGHHVLIFLMRNICVGVGGLGCLGQVKLAHHRQQGVPLSTVLGSALFGSLATGAQVVPTAL